MNHPRCKIAPRTTHAHSIAAPSKLTLEEVKRIGATVERSKKRILKSVEKLSSYKQFIEKCCLSSLITNCYTQCRCLLRLLIR